MYADRSRQLASATVRPLASLIPATAQSFGAFFGNVEQRRAVISHAVRQSIGGTGVLVVHSDTELEARLCDAASHAGVPAVLFGCLGRDGVPVAQYDPLYGLDEPAVLRALGVQDDKRISARVGDYLSIMDDLSRMDGAHSRLGAFPYSMVVMQALAALDYEELEEKVLSKLPPERREILMRKMSTAEDMWAVSDALRSLSNSLVALRPKHVVPSLAPRVALRSATSVICAGGLACVGIPAGDKAVLNQLDIEVEHLLRRDVPLTLVVAGLSVVGSRLASRFTTRHAKGLLRVGVASAMPCEVVETDDEVAGLIGTLERALVFSCPNAGVAKSLADSFGSYERTVRDTNGGWNIGFNELLPRLGRGYCVRKVQEGNIRAEDLVGMSGALVCGSDIPVPYTVRWLDLRS